MPSCNNIDFALCRGNCSTERRGQVLPAVSTQVCAALLGTIPSKGISAAGKEQNYEPCLPFHMKHAKLASSKFRYLALVTCRVYSSCCCMSKCCVQSDALVCMHMYCVDTQTNIVSDRIEHCIQGGGSISSCVSCMPCRKSTLHM